MDVNRRFADYIPREAGLSCCVVGLGAVGSYAALGISKIPNVVGLDIVDHDIVEPHNTTTQLYDITYCGMSKVVAFQVMFGQDKIRHIATEWALYSSIIWDVFVLGVDSNETRRDVIDAYRKQARELGLCCAYRWIIDLRAALRSAEAYVFRLDDQEAYETWVRETPSYVVSEPCSAQMSPAVGMYAGAYATAVVQQLLRNNSKVVPFHQSLQIERFQAFGWE